MFKINDYPYLADKTGAILPLTGGKKTILNLFRIEKPIQYVSTYEWYTTKARRLEGTITADWDATTTTGLPISAELAQTLFPNTILMVEDEYVKVKAVDKTANKIDVYRRWDLGSTAATHSNWTKIFVISNAEVEGGITAENVMSEKVRYENFIQEITDRLTLSKRAVNSSLKDYEDLVLEERQEKLETQLKKLQLNLIYGKPYKPAVGEADQSAWTAGGVKHYITTGGGVISTGALTQDNFDAFLTELANRESEVDVLIVNPFVKTKLAKLANYTEYVDAQQQNKDVYAGYNLLGFVSNTFNGRILQVVSSPLVKTNEIFAVKADYLRVYPVKDRLTGNTQLFDFVKETNTSSAVLDETLRTVYTTEIQKPDTMGIFVVS